MDIQEYEQTKSLADLEDFIDFIDPNLIQDQRFLNCLRKYRKIFDLEPEQYVEKIENVYKEKYGKKKVEQEEKVDDEKHIL